MPRTVHFLHRGQALCGFQTGMPKFWPSGHTWVGLSDIPRNEFEEVNCPGCLLQKQGTRPKGESESFKRISRYTILTDDDS